MKLTILFVIYAFVAKCSVSHGFDVVALQNGFNNHGIVAAFGDYNGDKLVDVFVISPDGMLRFLLKVPPTHRPCHRPTGG